MNATNVVESSPMELPVKQLQCPSCRTVFTRHITVPDDPDEVETTESSFPIGLMMVCMQCGAITQVNPDKTLRRVTQEDLSMFDDMPEFRHRMILAHQAITRSRRIEKAHLN